MSSSILPRAPRATSYSNRNRKQFLVVALLRDTPESSACIRKTSLPTGQNQHHCLKMSLPVPHLLLLPIPYPQAVSHGNHLCLIFRLFILLIDVPFLDEKTKNFQLVPSGRSRPMFLEAELAQAQSLSFSWLPRSWSRLPPADINQINYHTKTRFNLLRQYLRSPHDDGEDDNDREQIILVPRTRRFHR